jgi:hypothetical protein
VITNLLGRTGLILAAARIAFKAAVTDRHRRAYVGRHRRVAPLLPEVAPLPELKAYNHAAGAGRYAHLRVAELDAKATREQALAERGLTLRSPWGTPAEVDEWEPARAA